MDNMVLQTEKTQIGNAGSNTGKDLVANRARLGTKQKVKLLWNSIRENGFIWTCLLSIYYISSGIAEASFDKLQRVKIERQLPGTSGLKTNKEIWENWNWAAGGEEWTPSPEWKESLTNNVLRKYIRPGGHILEIGPGAGRWTGVLVEMSGTFTAVDIAESCIRICRQQYGDKLGTTFLVGNGQDLAGVADASIDSLWSFDVFVHINVSETARYVNEFKRVMRSGSVGVVHHGRDGGLSGGWRSNLTSAAFRRLLQDAGFRVVREFQTWQHDGKEYPVGLYHDEVTVFSLP
jgi:ubiquinone/menaquinone biosynthesis C-methylase UbiE